ncbi:MAG: transporter [Bacteroidota bacterium]
MRQLYWFFLLLPLVGYTQYSSTIQSDRPGQAIAPYTIGKRVLQFQTGYNYNYISTNEITTNRSAISQVIRYGLSERTEASLLVNWQTDQVDAQGSTDQLTGFNRYQLGGRVLLLTNEGARPALGLDGQAIFPVNAGDFEPANWGSVFTLATYNSLGEVFSLATNWQVAWSSFSAAPNWNGILNLGFSLGEKWNGFVETYTSLNTVQPKFDAGAAVLVHPDVQLDFSVGWQGNDTVTDWFGDVGCSWRFDGR